MEFSYNLEATVNHSVSKKYPSSLVSLKDLIIREYEDLTEDLFFEIFTPKGSDHIIIDVDEAEKHVADEENRPLNKSMDSAFAAIDKGGKVYIVLVEFRCNYENLKRLKRKDLIDKVQKSITLFGDKEQILGKKYFVFKASLAAQARNRFFRFKPILPEEYIPISLTDLKRFF